MKILMMVYLLVMVGLIEILKSGSKLLIIFLVGV